MNWRDRPLGDAPISVRAWNALKDTPYQTLGQLADTGDHVLLKIHNFGRVSLAEVRLALKVMASEAPAPTEAPRPPAVADDTALIVNWALTHRDVVRAVMRAMEKTGEE